MPIFRDNIFLGRLNRLLFVLLIISLIVSGFCASRSVAHIIKPSQWYFWTVVGDAVDGNSPSHKLIIDEEIYAPDALWTRDPLGVCNMQAATALANKNIMPPGIEYKNVWLCNNAGLIGDDFETRKKYFMSKVDAFYADYYYDTARAVIGDFLYGIGAWFALVIGIRIVRWVQSGSNKKS